MFRQFSRYFSIGILNTLIHWSIFGIVFVFFSQEQAVSNLIAFCCAVSFSFIMNAKFTFQHSTTFKKYLAYVTFMGVLSFLIGYIADNIQLYPLATQLVFSIVSLICGFFYSKYIVFRG